MYMGRGLTFFRDEWTFVITRDGHDATNFLSSYAGHLLLWPVAYFVFMFKAVGLDHYELYRLGALPWHLASAVLVYLIARRRIGDVVALAPAGVLLFLGSSWMNILWPFQLAFTGAIAFGLGAVLALQRNDLLGDAAACLLLVIAIGWSGVSLPFLPGVAVGLLLGGRLLKRVWVIAVPAAAYLVWLQKFGDQQLDYAGNLVHAPSYTLKMVGAGITGITGLPIEAGPYLALLLAAIAIARLWQVGRSSPLAWEALAMALAFWFLTAIARAQDNDPTALRYIYPSAVFLLLLAVGLAPRGAPRPNVAIVVLGLAVLTIPTNLAGFRAGRSDLLFTSNITSAELGAIELARDVVDPEYAPELNGFSNAVGSGYFFAATVRYASSPADTPEEIAGSPEYARRRADTVLTDALQVRLRRVPPGLRLESRGCSTLRGAKIEETTMLPRSGLLLRNGSPAPVRLGLRRFATSFQRMPQAIPQGAGARLRVTRDRAPRWPWYVGIEASRGPVTVCRIAPNPPASPKGRSR